MSPGLPSKFVETLTLEPMSSESYLTAFTFDAQVTAAALPKSQIKTVDPVLIHRAVSEDKKQKHSTRKRKISWPKNNGTCCVIDSRTIQVLCHNAEKMTVEVYERNPLFR